MRSAVVSDKEVEACREGRGATTLNNLKIYSRCTTQVPPEDNFTNSFDIACSTNQKFVIPVVRTNNFPYFAFYSCVSGPDENKGYPVSNFFISNPE